MPQSPLFALVDCNSFYVSCERVFAPKYAGVPVIVLSNNDGCIIAVSQEAKAAGIKMGSPFFEQRDLIRKHKMKVFSSNYALYGELSHRFSQVLSLFTPQVEQYSIDEAFLNFSGFDPARLTETGREIRERVLKWVGIPVSIGIAETKTLAKLANRIAKKAAAHGGVLDLTIPGRREEALSIMPVKDIWGVNSGLARRLAERGIFKAAQLRDADENWIRKRMGVVGVRLVYELRGVSCHALKMSVPPRKMITCSRSFGRSVATRSELNEAVAAYVSRAAVRLRVQGSSANSMTVFLQLKNSSSRTAEAVEAAANTLGAPRRRPEFVNREAVIGFPAATDNTTELIHYALGGVEALFEEGWLYRKAGVILQDLTPTSEFQFDIFNPAPRARSEGLMSTIDLINKRFNRDALHFATQGQTQPWKMKCDMRSPDYLAQWKDLRPVKA